MFTSMSKIRKAKGGQPDELEESVAQAIYELQMNSEKLKGPLQECHITAAKEIDVGDGKQAIVVFVPVPMLAQFQKLTKERRSSRSSRRSSPASLSSSSPSVASCARRAER